MSASARKRVDRSGSGLVRRLPGEDEGNELAGRDEEVGPHRGVFGTRLTGVRSQMLSESATATSAPSM